MSLTTMSRSQMKIGNFQFEVHTVCVCVFFPDLMTSVADIVHYLRTAQQISVLDEADRFLES